MKTVLSIGTHPDDIEIGCGGTEALLQAKGYSIVHIIVTSGEEGSTTLSGEDLMRQREEEAGISAKILGVGQVIFLRHPDGLTAYTKEMKIELIRLIRKFQPEIAFTHSSHDHFPDHSVVHSLSLSALIGSAGPWYAQAQGEPYFVPKVLGYEVWNPIGEHQIAIDISSTINQKLSALQCHFSQTGAVDYLSVVKGLAQYRGALSMKGRYAEVFETIRSEGII